MCRDRVLDDRLTGVGQAGFFGIDHGGLQKLHGDIHCFLKGRHIVVLAKLANDRVHAAIGIVSQCPVLDYRDVAVLVNVIDQLFQCFGYGCHRIFLGV
ncbi:hypothetical protein D3C87_1587870 [compost metagenome]